MQKTAYPNPHSNSLTSILVSYWLNATTPFFLQIANFLLAGNTHCYQFAPFVFLVIKTQRLVGRIVKKFVSY